MRMPDAVRSLRMLKIQYPPVNKRRPDALKSLHTLKIPCPPFNKRSPDALRSLRTLNTPCPPFSERKPDDCWYQIHMWPCPDTWELGRNWAALGDNHFCVERNRDSDHMSKPALFFFFLQFPAKISTHIRLGPVDKMWVKFQPRQHWGHSWWRHY